jgi:hypothetical protein
MTPTHVCRGEGAQGSGCDEWPRQTDPRGRKYRLSPCQLRAKWQANLTAVCVGIWPG